MKMSRSHFQALASMCARILNRLDNMTEHDHEMILNQFVALGYESNSAFDRDKFVAWVDELVI